MEKDWNKFKRQKKKAILFHLSSSDDDFIEPMEGSSKTDTSSRKPLQPDANELKKQKDREKNARYRAKKTDQQKQMEAQESAVRMKKFRENQTDEQKQIEARAAAVRMKKVRDKQTPEEKQKERDNARQRMARLRLPTLTRIKPKDGLRSQDVLNGMFRVPGLEESLDKIGEMDHDCDHCGAMKFAKETSTTCCNGGKVLLTQFPRPPEDLMKLWKGNDPKSRLFRQNSRMFNNAVCLSSLKVNLRTFQGFTPSIVFQGRVQHRAGSLLPADGDVPRFAQLYVYDPAFETSQRFQNMVVPGSMSAAQKDILKKLLQDIQSVIHEVNPFVKDFKQIIEMPEEEISEGKIVITAKTPNNEHTRRYNAPVNLQEVSILIDPGKHDLVLQRRGGGLQTISDLNPKGMPLHFTLLFPFGTHGWDPEYTQAAGDKRVTPREFYAFHLNVRHGDHENFLHMSCKLFQEWICMGWVHVENQRLNYQSQN